LFDSTNPWCQTVNPVFALFDLTVHPFPITAKSMTLLIRTSRLRLSQGQLFWHEVGTGQVLVFLHGAWEDSSEWLPVIEQLGGRYHCVAPDLLGFGESERPKIHYSIEVEVESLADYLETLKLKGVHLIGQGIGGWIAASYALKYSGQVESLTLLGAEGVPIEGDRRWRWAGALLRIPLCVWALRSLLPVARLLKRDAGIEQLLQLRRTLKRSPTACQLLFNRRRAEIRAELLHERLEWLKLPVLILQGEQDSSIVTALNRAYAQAPLADVRSLPGQDLVQTAPEAVAEEIRNFIKAIAT
jgi:pimeloyl-ACP methyl ester carboxylesterase